MRVWAQPSLRALRGLAGWHVKDEDLLALRDGELGRLGRWCLRIHLGRCGVCRREAELIEEDLLRSRKIDDLLFTGDVLNLQTGLGGLRRAMADWEAQRGRDSRGPAEVLGESGLRGLAAEFNFYLGNQARITFLSRMKSRADKHRDPLLEAESVLSDFLGPGAAAAIARRISYTRVAGARTGQSSPAS